MRGLVFFLILLAIACFAYMMVKRGARPANYSKAKWRVRPRTLESGERQIWLVCPGEPDYLQWDEKRYAERVDDLTWDSAITDAELQAREFNRLRREGLRELPR